MVEDGRHNNSSLPNMSSALIDLPSRPKILLMRQDRIGDVFVSTPLFHALRQRFPDAQIDVLLSRNNKAAEFAIRSVVNNVHILRKNSLNMLRLLWRLRRERYDLLVDLNHSASTTSNMLISSAKAKHSIALETNKPTPATHIVPQGDRRTRHIVDVLCDLLLPIGIVIPRPERQPRIMIRQDVRQHARSALRIHEHERILGVQISGSSNDRMYPAESWRIVLTLIKNQLPDVSIVVLSAPSEYEQAARLAQQVGARFVNPGNTYEHFAAAIAECDWLASPDTAAVHVAAACNVPSVVLFTKDHRGYLNWMPYGSFCWPIITEQASLSAIPTTAVIDNVGAMVLG